MKTFDLLLEEDIEFYHGKHDDVVCQGPAFFRLLARLANDSRLPSRLRSLVLSAIAYFVLPGDVFPEEYVGPYGYIDDIYVGAFVADCAAKSIGDTSILEQNWDGDEPVDKLVADILARESELIGDLRGKILGYIGYSPAQE